RFKEVTGRYPLHITVVDYDFKRKRFETVHRKALRISSSNFEYLGIHPGGLFDGDAAETGELENSLKPFRIDPYGCHSEVLQSKREERNPYRRTPPYQISCPEMRPLLEWCGPEFYSGEVPWDTAK
ncbi:unnamed protein product, partial [Choristocarpus tenellus]